MALATLNGLPVPNMDPPWTLMLSHSSSLESAFPKEPLCAQFVKVPSKDHVLLNATAQDVFCWFRSAGPLVTVQTNVDVGYPNRTCVVQYWDEEHALSALTKPRSLHHSFEAVSQFTLRSFAQCSVLGSVGGVSS